MGTIIFLFLILTQFYGYMGLQGLPFMLTTHVGILVLGVFLGYKKGNLFNKYLIMMVVSLILCAISSKVYRNQSFISSLYASLFILDIFFFYFLVYLNVGVKRFEKVLVILIVATCLGFILQHLFFPKIIFFASAGEWISLSATPHRFIQITAQSLISLGIFLGFNKFLELKNKLYAILSFVCFVCILIRGFRIMLLAAIVSLIWILYKYNKTIFSIKNILKIAGVLLMFSFSLLIPVVQESIGNMVLRQTVENNTLDNQDYARTIQLAYYFGEHFKNTIEFFLGSGLPGNSPYGLYISEELPAIGINWVDWGLLGLSWLGGVPLVICMLLYMIKCIWLTRYSRKNRYISAWFIYLLIISVTHPEVYQFGSMLVQGMVLYLVLRLKKTGLLDN